VQRIVRHLKINGRRVEWYESIDSTMLVAARLAREGCEHGTTVVADEQTAGIGRHGRSWHSEKGAGLYVSIVLRMPQPVPVMMLALGLAAREAIAKTTALRPDLRWPNDVLMGGRKCAGMLAQVEGGAVIAGIGINISQTGFPEELEATSLLLEGAKTTREEILAALVEAVDEYCGKQPAEIRRLFEVASSYARGLRVRVEQNGVEGVTQGLDPSGFLIVRQDNGQYATILAGGVRPCC
jgi:BirA family transcriptional regulator, biotin operon repressor / biotin---[acetyl-CoA-carboxylase] ligase